MQSFLNQRFHVQDVVIVHQVVQCKYKYQTYLPPTIVKYSMVKALVIKHGIRIIQAMNMPKRINVLNVANVKVFVLNI